MKCHVDIFAFEQHVYHRSFALLSLQTAWIFFKRYAEYKPLQFLAFAFVYRIFEKLKALEPPSSPTFTVSYDCKLMIIFQCLMAFSTRKVLSIFLIRMFSISFN